MCLEVSRCFLLGGFMIEARNYQLAARAEGGANMEEPQQPQIAKRRMLHAYMLHAYMLHRLPTSYA